jgi:hypothetical protein
MAAARARTVEESKPRSDAYVGLLAISLIAMLTGALLLFLDWSQYPETKAPKVQETLPARPQPQPAGSPGGQVEQPTPPPDK